MSERRACRVIAADRKSVRYRSIRDDDAALREKLRDLANQRRRFAFTSVLRDAEVRISMDGRDGGSTTSSSNASGDP